jgi:hypothetical protein
MRYRKLRTLAPLCLLLFAFSNFSAAQDDVTAVANIPFDFWVGGTHFQSGEYIIDKTEPAMIIVRSKDSKTNKTIEQAGTILYGDPVPPANARLIFIKQNGKFQLAEVWGRLGKRVLTNEYDHNNGDGVRVVQLQYASASQASQLHP